MILGQGIVARGMNFRKVGLVISSMPAYLIFSYTNNN